MIRPFNKSVLVGNWYEDRVLEEDVLKDYLEKRERGQLVNQNEESKRISIGQIPLTTVTDGKIHIGDIVMVKCDGNVNQESPLIAKAYRSDCHLSSACLLKNANTVPATGTPSPAINEKTAFMIQSVDGSPFGTPLRFGQAFAISTVDKSFYLHSDHRTYDKAAHKSRLQIVDFVSVYNHECDWVATCLNPQFRLEAEGTEILANDKVVLLHMKTNKSLAVVTDFNRSSNFEIVAHTFFNSHKAEEDNNHWRFVTHIPQIAIPEDGSR